MPNQTLGTRELLDVIQRDPHQFMRDAYSRGMNISTYMEHISPTQGDTRSGVNLVVNDDGTISLDFVPAQNLDAFERCLAAENIVTRSDPARGQWASKVGDFLDTPHGRVLYSEYFARKWREVSFRGRRDIYLSTDDLAGSWARPYAEAQSPRWDFQLAPAVPLSELVGMTTPIDGQDYRSFYMTYDATALRKFRLGEAAEIPIAKLADSERTIRLKKFGRGLEASYEQLRRMRVDKLALQIGYMAIQSEVDKVDAALSTLVNGDGNSGTSPTTYNLTTLDSGASAGTLSLKGWIAFKLKFANPYIITAALMQEATALQLLLLNAGSGNVPLMGLSLGGQVQQLTPINVTSDAVRYGWLSSAPSLKIVAYDRRFALERVTEIGGEIDEMDRFIRNQTEVITMTEVEGYAIMYGNATKILDVNA